MSAGEAIVRVSDLSVDYRRGEVTRRALANVSLELRAGEVTALVGESGSGKSTLGAALVGLLPDSAGVSGSLVIDGNECAHADERTWSALRGRSVALQFQDALAALDPLLAIGEQVGEGLRHADGIVGAELERRVHAVLARVGLPEPARCAGLYPHQLSGGMRQRAALACALAREPRVLVADEPTSALDATLGARIVALLREQAERHRLAVLWITHDIAAAASAADRIAVLFAGRVVELAPARELVMRPLHPYTAALVALARTRERTTLSTSSSEARSTGIARNGCPYAPRCSLAITSCAERVPRLEEVAPAHEVACPRWSEVRVG